MRLFGLGSWGVGAALGLGCAASSGPCPAPPRVAPAVVAIPAAEPTAIGAKPSAPGPTTASRCFPEGRPAARVAANASTYCAALELHEVARVEAELKRSVTIDTKPSKLVIDFGCDLAYGSPSTLVFEQGSGHGGSLVVTRLSRGIDRWSVRRIVSNGYAKKPVTVEVGDVVSTTIGPLIAAARVALLARPHVIPLFDAGSGTGLGGGSYSSNDFHLLLAIVDDAGRATTRGFTGYDSSFAQGDILPMRLATDPLVKVLEATSFSVVEPDSDDRAFFTERLIATTTGPAAWWVRERYLENARVLATRDAVPALAEQIVKPVPKGKDGSEVRSRDRAVEALHAVTGWDPRFDGNGQPQSIEAAVAAVREECVLE